MSDQVRSSPTLKHTPTVILSTSDHPSEVMMAYPKWVNSYLKKLTIFTDYDDLMKALETCFLQAISE